MEEMGHGRDDHSAVIETTADDEARIETS